MPADAVTVEIEKAIEKEIREHDWGVEVLVDRNYGSPKQPLEQLDVLRIDVVHWLTTIDQEAEGVVGYLVRTDILVRKRFSITDQDSDGGVATEEVDTLIKLIEDLQTFFMPVSPSQSGRALTDVPDAHFEPEEKQHFADYLRPQLDQLRQFTGWFRIAYSTQRDAAELST